MIGYIVKNEIFFFVAIALIQLDLVSLSLGKMCVGSHTLCSFVDWVGLRSSDATAAYLLFQPLKLHL